MRNHQTAKVIAFKYEIFHCYTKVTVLFLSDKLGTEER